MKKKNIILLLLYFSFACSDHKKPAGYVNPFIGACRDWPISWANLMMKNYTGKRHRVTAIFSTAPLTGLG